MASVNLPAVRKLIVARDPPFRVAAAMQELSADMYDGRWAKWPPSDWSILLPVRGTHVGGPLSNETVPDMWRAIGPRWGQMGSPCMFERPWQHVMLYYSVYKVYY